MSSQNTVAWGLKTYIVKSKRMRETFHIMFTPSLKAPCNS